MTDIVDFLKNHVENAFENADKNISKINDEIISLVGMTGTKTRHFYNNLLNFEDARYLEIGTWMGSSVCSAMFENKANVTCVDNFSEFADNNPRDTFLKNFEKFKGENNARFIEADCFKLEPVSLPKFNIYMYDGDHKHECHYNALLHFYSCLDDVFVFIVDDWNWEVVRNATKESIERLNLKVCYEKEIFVPLNDTNVPFNKNTWWNGIYVAILQKNN